MLSRGAGTIPPKAAPRLSRFRLQKAEFEQESGSGIEAVEAQGSLPRRLMRPWQKRNVVGWIVPRAVDVPEIALTCAVSNKFAVLMFLNDCCRWQQEAALRTENSSPDPPIRVLSRRLCFKSPDFAAAGLQLSNSVPRKPLSRPPPSSRNSNFIASSELQSCSKDPHRRRKLRLVQVASNSPPISASGPSSIIIQTFVLEQRLRF